MLSLDKLDKYGDTDAKASVPNIGADLLAAQAAGYFDGLSADLSTDRLMAALELLRHREITITHAATLSGITVDQLIAVLRKLTIASES